MTTILGLLGFALVPTGVALIAVLPFPVAVAVIVAGVELVYLSFANQPEPQK